MLVSPADHFDVYLYIWFRELGNHSNKIIHHANSIASILIQDCDINFPSNYTITKVLGFINVIQIWRSEKKTLYKI